MTGYYYDPDEDLVHSVFLCERIRPDKSPIPSPPEILQLGWWALGGLPHPISDFTVRRIQDAVAGARLPLPIVVGPRHWIDSDRTLAT